MTNKDDAKPLVMAESDKLVNDEQAGLDRLMEIMRRLRDPQTGCPWDIEQDSLQSHPIRLKRLTRSPTLLSAANGGVP